MHGPGVDGHLDGAALVRFLDGEGPTADRDRAGDHLRRCHACAAELRILRDEAERVSHWLRRHDHAAPTPPAAQPAVATGRSPRPDGWSGVRSASRRWSVPTWAKAAAAVLLVTAPAVAVPGVRDWLVARVAGPAAVADEEAATAAATATPETRLVRFVPAPGTFTVRFDAVEPGGTLRLERAATEEAVLLLESSAEPTVSSTALRIRNGADAPDRPGSAPRYTLRLPAGTPDVRVVVAGDGATVSAAELDRGVVIPLSGPDGR